MNKLYLFVVLQIIILFPMFVSAQTKRALVIGLGKQEDAAWNKINGDKDIPYVLEILNDANYEQIVTLVNEQATKANIVSALVSMEQSCQVDDIVYIHYSGHGQLMRDAGNDESDDLDECWIPYDAYRRPCDNDNGEKHLTDDEVNVFLNNIRNKIGENGKMIVVIDACHSGDATRSNDETVRGVEDVFEAVKSYVADWINYRVNHNEERWITLSACESHQVNVEMNNPVVGKLTYALYTKIKEKKLGDNNALFKEIRKFVKNTGSRPQRPVMSGDDKDKYNITDILL